MMRMAVKSYNNESGQILTLLGILLALSVFVLASMASEISDLNLVVPSERASSLLKEFNNIKDTFGLALNYNLVNISIVESTRESEFYGDISNIMDAFNQTRDSFFIIEMRHGIFFHAVLNSCGYVPLEAGNVYKVDVTLILTDSETSITKEMGYYITCKPYL